MKKRKRARGPQGAILLSRGTNGRNYDDIIKAAFAAAPLFGSAANALATFARESPTYRQISADLAAKTGVEETENREEGRRAHGAKKTVRAGRPRRL